jgi:hypothetical protein
MADTGYSPWGAYLDTLSAGFDSKVDAGTRLEAERDAQDAAYRAHMWEQFRAHIGLPPTPQLMTPGVPDQGSVKATGFGAMPRPAAFKLPLGATPRKPQGINPMPVPNPSPAVLPQDDMAGIRG